MSTVAHPAVCPPTDDSNTASWCYTSAPTGPPAEACAPFGGGILAFSLASITGSIYVACFPLPSP